MNYANPIMENKILNTTKEIVYNISLAICIILFGVLIMVYGFKYQLYEILSDSEAPYFVTGDLIVVKEKPEYEVGDIIQFEYDKQVAHRLVAIHETGGKKYYICHGDNNQSTMWEAVEGASYRMPWEEESKHINSLLEQGKFDYIKNNTHLQVITKSQINGVYVDGISGLGFVVKYVKDHYLLVVALVASIWCIFSVLQNESERKRSLRLF